MRAAEIVNAGAYVICSHAYVGNIGGLRITERRLTWNASGRARCPTCGRRYRHEFLSKPKKGAKRGAK